jgi:hypothetical protein
MSSVAVTVAVVSLRMATALLQRMPPSKHAALACACMQPLSLHLTRMNAMLAAQRAVTTAV